MPENLEGWFDFAWKVGAGLAALWSVAVLAIRKPLVEQINGLGVRLKEQEASMSSAEGRIGALERTDETHNYQVAALHERQGKLEGRQEINDRMLEETLRKLESRLGNIEGKLSIIVSRGEAK